MGTKCTRPIQHSNIQDHFSPKLSLICVMFHIGTQKTSQACLQTGRCNAEVHDNDDGLKKYDARRMDSALEDVAQGMFTRKAAIKLEWSVPRTAAESTTLIRLHRLHVQT